jgi:hypothetical protein
MTFIPLLSLKKYYQSSVVECQESTLGDLEWTKTEPSWALLLQRLSVQLLVVWKMIFPTTIDDSDPSIGESPDGLINSLTLSSLVIIVGMSPDAEHNGFGGKLMEALLDKLGAGEASMYPRSFTATLRNRCNAGILRDIQDNI